MSRPIRSSIEYANKVAWWTTKFSKEMQSYANASVAIVAYYLRGNTAVVACPSEMEEFKAYGEEMRTNSVMFAAAEDSGLLAEAIPALFRLALENHNNWCQMSSDIAFLLQHPHLCRFVPYEYRVLADAAEAANAALSEDDERWYEFVQAAKSKLSARLICNN